MKANSPHTPRALWQCPQGVRQSIRGVFTDIDDTLTTDGRLHSSAYAALERLFEAGFMTVPVTGRPAGWCDHIARMWPVHAVVGENGAFYMRYDHSSRRMHCVHRLDSGERKRNRVKLEALAEVILQQVPGSALASDQSYRSADLAIDYCEDVPRLDANAVSRIVQLFQAAGAHAKVSSIHVNGWFGEHDKLSTAMVMMREWFNVDLHSERDHYMFVGDSPNDAPMFGFFPYAVGVANVMQFIDDLESPPAFVTRSSAGRGFAEVVDWLIALPTATSKEQAQ